MSPQCADGPSDRSVKQSFIFPMRAEMDPGRFTISISITGTSISSCLCHSLDTVVEAVLWLLTASARLSKQCFALSVTLCITKKDFTSCGRAARSRRSVRRNRPEPVRVEFLLPEPGRPLNSAASRGLRRIIPGRSPGIASRAVQGQYRQRPISRFEPLEK